VPLLYFLYQFNQYHKMYRSYIFLNYERDGMKQMVSCANEFCVSADTSQTYLYFLMLHACLYTICFVFCYTSWRFNAFSGTNLLTRCHSANSLFSSVLVFQKSYTGNILGIGRNKAEPPIFTEASRRPKMRRRGARGQAHHRLARPSPWPRHHMVRPGGAAPPHGEARWPTS
jgi:hypothetical protein